MSDRLVRLRAWARQQELAVALTLVLVLFALAFLWPSILISIGPGERGVLWSRFFGTRIDRFFPEGLHAIAPWNEMAVYDTRFQIENRTYTVLSSDGLPIVIDLAVRYHPAEKLIARLHDYVGPDYLNVVVMPEVVTALRSVVAQYSVTSLHQAPFADMQREVLKLARTQAASRWVLVDDILFRGVKLPPRVVNAIEGKIEQEQAAAEMVHRLAREQLEAQRKVIEATGVRDAQQIINQTLNDRLLQYKGIEATLELARSPNAKIVVIGGDGTGLPLILGPDAVAAKP